MLFATLLEVVPGHYKRAIKLFKTPVLPEGVKLREALWLFGKPDAVIIFEAPDEKTAGEFVVQFGDVANIKTSLAFGVKELRWVP